VRKKKVVKQTIIDKVQANVICAESDLCVYFTEDSKEESKEESKVSATGSCTLEKLTPSVSSKRSRGQAAGLNTHKKGKYTTERQHQQLSSALIKSGKATYTPASSLTKANSMSAKIVSTSNSTLPNASPGPPSNIGIAQCTADAQNPARALKLALKEHTDSHYEIHRDLLQHNELAELKIDRLEQIVDAVVKTQRDLSRNGQVRVPENFVGAIHHGLQCCSKYNLSDCFVIPCRSVLCHGQKFCEIENLSHSNTNSSSRPSETQAPSKLGDDKQISILYQN